MGRATGIFLSCAVAVTLTVSQAGRAEAAGMLIAEDGFGGQLTIEEHTVKVVVNNGVAVTTVTQVFRNTENRTVEALYTFPVPGSASVSNFSMWINGKEMVGEVVEKERARQIYESYKRVNKDPGLLEQTSYKTFEMRIFPIGPKAEQKVEITYYQELDVDNDWATYVYPLASDTRRDMNPRVSGRFGLSLEVKSEVPIAELKSVSHPDDFAVAKHTPNYCHASMETSGGSLHRDLVLAYRLERPKTGLDLVTSKHPGEDGYFCLILTAGKELENVGGGMDYVFVMDVSGSMGADGKLTTSRGTVEAFVKSLGKGDRFEVVTFNVQPNGLFGQLSAVEEAAMEKAGKELRTLRPNGGTSLVPAMQLAYRYAQVERTLNVVLLSDGLTEESERSTLLNLIRNRPENSRVFCVGVGNEVNRPLLQQVASDAGGLAAFISRGDDFERQAQAFRRKLTRPAATDISIAFKGVEVHDLIPAELPNLYHGQPVRLYGRYAGSGPVTCSVTGRVAGHEIRQEAELDLPDLDEDNPEIDRMWAWRVVQALQAEGDRIGSRSQMVDKIVALGEAYSIATEYTSFIVLENDTEYRRWQIERRNALRIARDRQAQARLRDKLEAMRTEAMAQLGPAGAETQQTADAGDQSGPAVPGQNNVPRPQVRDSGRRRGVDFHLGGGAVDPLTAGLCGGLVMLVLAGSRSRRRGKGAE